MIVKTSPSDDHLEMIKIPPAIPPSPSPPSILFEVIYLFIPLKVTSKLVRTTVQPLYFVVLSGLPYPFPGGVWLLRCGAAVTWDQPWDKSCVRMICNNFPWELQSSAWELLSAQPWSLPQPCSCLDGSLAEPDRLAWLPGLPQLCLITMDSAGDLGSLLTLSPILGFPWLHAVGHRSAGGSKTCFMPPFLPFLAELLTLLLLGQYRRGAAPA